jgi:NAD(P)H-nitrite reductase large subunit/ferredoxin
MPGEAVHVADGLLRAAERVHAGEVLVSFENGPTVRAKVGDALLDIAEASQVPIESGCRMGMCGSDPIRIVEGAENLSAVRSAERRTLDRLGLGADCRMACVTRVQGSVVIAVHPDLHAAPKRDTVEPLPRAAAAGRGARDAVRRVVVLGAGVAGVTVAEELRSALPDAELTLIGAEPYEFYNRMAITRLVSESASIDSLYLNRRDWAESRRIDYRRGVPAVAFDRGSAEVETESGERFGYDRLVLATGASPFVPPIEGFGVAGTFVLRTIDDAVQIQQHIRARRCETAVIVGAGLLGLEAAYNIAQLGVRVFVLDRGPWPLSRQLDEHGGAILWQMLHDLGIEVLRSSEARCVLDGGGVSGIELLDGSTITAQLTLVSAGVEPNAQLGRAAGLEVAVGISVDDHMRTSDAHVFAVGDVADHGGRRYGLWPASVEQAQVAVQNMIGVEARYDVAAVPARLKVPGIDLLSVGAFDARGEDAHAIAVSDQGNRRYRKLVLENGRVAGAIVLGSPELFDIVTQAVEERLEVGAELDALEQGDWTSLSRAAEPATLARTDRSR